MTHGQATAVLHLVEHSGPLGALVTVVSGTCKAGEAVATTTRGAAAMHSRTCVSVDEPPPTGLEAAAALPSFANSGAAQAVHVCGQGLYLHPEPQSQSRRTAAAGGQDVSLGLEVAARLAHRVARQGLWNPSPHVTSCTALLSYEHAMRSGHHEANWQQCPGSLRAPPTEQTPTSSCYQHSPTSYHTSAHLTLHACYLALLMLARPTGADAPAWAPAAPGCMRSPARPPCGHPH